MEITLGTLVDQLFARTLTLRVAFDFLNESKGVSMAVNVLAPPNQWSLYMLLEIWVLANNAFGMCRITAIFTIVEPMLWVTFFFTNITIIFIGIIFSSITESKGMLMLIVPCGLW